MVCDSPPTARPPTPTPGMILKIPGLARPMRAEQEMQILLHVLFIVTAKSFTTLLEKLANLD